MRVASIVDCLQRLATGGDGNGGATAQQRAAAGDSQHAAAHGQPGLAAASAQAAAPGASAPRHVENDDEDEDKEVRPCICDAPVTQ